MKVLKETLIILLAAAILSLMLPVFSGIDTSFGASKVRLNKTSLLMHVGSTYRLRLKGTSKKVVWRTKSKAVVTVSSKGKLKAKKSGRTTVYAKVGKKKYSCKVYVGKTIISNAYVTIAYINTRLDPSSGTSVKYGTAYFAIKNKYKAAIECTPQCLAFDGQNMDVEDSNSLSIRSGSVGLLYMGVYDMKSTRHKNLSAMFAFIASDYSSMQRVVATNVKIGTVVTQEFTVPVGTVILDNSEFTLTYVKYDRDDGAVFYLTNKTGKYINFNFGETKVNGVKYADAGQDYDVYFAPYTSGYYSYPCTIESGVLQSLKGSIIFNDNSYDIEKTLQ